MSALAMFVVFCAILETVLKGIARLIVLAVVALLRLLSKSRP